MTGALFGCNDSPRERVVSIPARSASLQEPTPSALDTAVAKHVTADELYTIYSQDLTIGATPDQRFDTQLLIVTGIVNGVNRRLEPAVYLELRTHDKDSFVYAEFNPDLSYVPQTLLPGAEVHLLCRGDSMIGGNPIVRACRPI